MLGIFLVLSVKHAVHRQDWREITWGSAPDFKYNDKNRR